MSVTNKLRACMPGVTAAAELRHRYLELLTGALTHTLYDPIDRREMPEYVKESFGGAFKETGVNFRPPSPLEERLDGRDRPVYAQTMVGVYRIRNVRHCVESALTKGIPGDLIEAGTWRGGAAIMMRGVLEAHHDPDRRLVVADSFEGLPKPDGERYPADAPDLNYTSKELAISLEEVQANFERYGLLDDRTEFVKGWFHDTLPGLQDRKWAVIRLDGDLYESTMDGLTNLYPQLSPGGFLIVDDYGFPNCRQAIDDYRAERGIAAEVTQVDWAGAFWRKPA